MKIRIIKATAGMFEGFENDVPEFVAKTLIAKGVAEEVKAAPKKEAAPIMETKEEKNTSKRRTKNRK